MPQSLPTCAVALREKAELKLKIQAFFILLGLTRT
jgi:hypothetical protein